MESGEDMTVRSTLEKNRAKRIHQMITEVKRWQDDLRSGRLLLTPEESVVISKQIKALLKKIQKLQSALVNGVN